MKLFPAIDIKNASSFSNSPVRSVAYFAPKFKYGLPERSMAQRTKTSSMGSRNTLRGGNGGLQDCRGTLDQGDDTIADRKEREIYEIMLYPCLVGKSLADCLP